MQVYMKISSPTSWAEDRHPIDSIPAATFITFNNPLELLLCIGANSE
jgi:hypothetical protein